MPRMTEVTRSSTICQTALKLCGVVIFSTCLTLAKAQTTPVRPTGSTFTLTSSWQQLNKLQKQALAPLAGQWSQLTPQQQSKWLAISQNFAQLPAAEQATMHARMTDWAALSPLQRTQARYNFNVVQTFTQEDKKAKWEAYQALSVEDKRLLSVGTPPPAKSAAPIAKPVSASRLIAPSLRPIDSARDITRSDPSVQSIDRKTLLPKPVPIGHPEKTTEPAVHLESTDS